MGIHDFRGAVEKRQTNAAIIRETDAMRQGVGGTLIKVDSMSAVVVTEDEFMVGESVKLELRNTVQRYCCRVRGELKSVRKLRGEYEVEVKLLTRLNPHEVMTLRMQLHTAAQTNWL